jgi:hypothetical protein
LFFGGGEQLRNRGRPFSKKLASEGIVVTEALDEGRDCLVMRDFRDLEAHIQEASDVVT